MLWVAPTKELYSRGCGGPPWRVTVRPQQLMFEGLLKVLLAAGLRFVGNVTAEGNRRTVTRQGSSVFGTGTVGYETRQTGADAHY